MSTPSQEIAAASRRNTRTGSLGFLSSLPNTSDLAKASLARDLEECSDYGVEIEGDSDSEDATLRPGVSAPSYGLLGSRRRPSIAGAGNRSIIYTVGDIDTLSKEERQQAIAEERSLLLDNQLIPPKHPDGAGSKFRIPFAGGEGRRASETAPLLSDTSIPYGGEDDPKQIIQKWNEAISAGKIQTTWQREAKVIIWYSLPLMATFVLQYSLTVASILTVGHIGTAELGAVSLASMTVNITGYAIYQGLATSLDTLCAQAYGSGRKKLVGLQMQRMIYFLWLLTVPIGILWLLSDKILGAIVPDRNVARLAGLYLKIVTAGLPGIATFEAGKRYIQAQGLFTGGLYVLIFCAPFNAFMNWLFVWKLDMGFIGAPLAVAITDNLLPFGLFIYVRFISKDGMSCWNGFTRKAFSNWMPMIKLALPGVLMVEAEMIAFEILTFAASLFGTTELAAQSVLSTMMSLTYQIPFPLSIASSTRVANLIGATLVDAARLSTRVSFAAAVCVGLMNVTILSTLRNYIPHLFTSDPGVIRIVSQVLPYCAAFQLFDALGNNCNGILRGLGRQEVGGYIQLFCYYVIAMPISFGTAFGLGWGVLGLWSGVSIALAIVSISELTILYGFLDWNRSVEEAKMRNNLDA